MNPSHNPAIREQIETFLLDDPDSPGAFATKLARENGWNAAFTERAVVEYRRYLILAAIAGHPVSPSEAVDAVWHQHLLFTRSYWDRLCRDVLKFPLHHEPARGSHAEKEKFDDWYARTYQSYLRIFGETPPGDIWPTPQRRSSDRSRFVRVDVSRNWIVGKFNVAQWAAVSLVLVLVVALAAGCRRVATPLAVEPVSANIVAQGWNPFDFTGRQFLVFYCCAFVAACVAAAIFRRNALNATGAGTVRPDDLDPYQIAYLNGGRRLVVNAAVAHLIAQKKLSFDQGAKKLIATDAGINHDRPYLHTVEKTLLSQAREPVELARVHERLAPTVEQVRSGLQQRGLVADDSAVASARAIGLVLTLGVVAVGLIKLFVGLSRSRPVGYLVVLLLASVVIALAVFARKSERTRRGNEALSAARERTDEQSAGPAIAAGTMTAAMAMALFGPSVLAGVPELSGLRQTIRDSRGGDGGGGGCGGCGGGGD
jgi:uncharacterized protein (TIGR04222 family)